MIILIDLDGTLVNTASESFKPMKDGKIDTDPNFILPFNGAIEFVKKLVELGHTPIVVSDSVGKYVNPVVSKYFGIPAISMAYKPNPKVTEEYLLSKGIDLSNCEEILIIGDTWLDIELGRSFGFRTILTQFYKANMSSENQQDGIGKTWNHLKSGPTYVARTFEEVIKILTNPLGSLWAAEAIMQGVKTSNAIRLFDASYDGEYKIFRALGRQEDGECDRYGIGSSYKEFHREYRSIENLKKLAECFENYVKSIQAISLGLKWDYFTYVSDKASTTPPNKLKVLFDLIELGLPKDKILAWKDVVDGSIRNRPHYKERRDFIRQNLFVSTEFDLSGKSIIIIDDQFTTGGTAHEVADMLKQRGAKHILFITMFFMTSLVMSRKSCPKCGKPMKIQMRKSDGNKFYSCTPPQYRGTGCGHIENYG